MCTSGYAVGGTSDDDKLMDRNGHRVSLGKLPFEDSMEREREKERPIKASGTQHWFYSLQTDNQ